MPHSKIRIDLHVHSKFSTRPSQWILQKIGCPESFADPVDIYRIAREKGMTLVTITDHNCIDGALEIAHLQDTFISEEITTYFPEDHCKVHVLADVFKALAVSTDNIHLIVVGDGSYVNEMKFALRHTPCTFTGYLSGDDLATVYASSDIFVFPSTTDTLGRAVLEAQASGLPAIVSDQGGPHDNVIPGETGLVVKGNDTNSLLNAILTLISDPHRIRQMGHAARKYVEDRCLDTAFFDPGLTDKSDSTQAASPLAEAV